MEGWIVSFRRGMNKYYPRQVILSLDGVTYKDAVKVIGRKVLWVHPETGEKFVGKIVRMHGRRGHVLAYFKRHLPGQAVGTKVKIV
ncbi:50S ribosomal protein L35ae [Thermofilum pendens]|uniref:Large ribosomal subunit protein eL33 n=1 Tax=Thermofilum pendens (strain DSM 2475 / Hrk 5) TaxID=368408 RepID=A1RX00_THEPD|nr:50S ribosomal protein L35ae [Thermofilum pendens]ABL77730.1 LSU ribosomal protein L35AE [Thermofilum pendens Hrk 5]